MPGPIVGFHDGGMTACDVGVEAADKDKDSAPVTSSHGSHSGSADIKNINAARQPAGAHFRVGTLPIRTLPSKTQQQSLLPATSLRPPPNPRLSSSKTRLHTDSIKMAKTSACVLLALALLSALFVSTNAGPLAYGICQSGCNAVAVACYGAAGVAYCRSVTAGQLHPAYLGAQAMCGRWPREL